MQGKIFPISVFIRSLRCSGLAQKLRHKSSITPSPLYIKPPLPPMGDDCDAGQAAERQNSVILSPKLKIEYHARIDDTAEVVTFTASVDGDARAIDDRGHSGTTVMKVSLAQ
jgi:hypothetical protein